MGKRLLVEAGAKYGQWTVVGDAGNDKRSHSISLCRCTCGNVATVSNCELRRGRSTKCQDCGYKASGLIQTKPIFNGLGTRQYNIIAYMARRRGIEFHLTIQDAGEIFAKCKGICKFCGGDLCFDLPIHAGRNKGNASLDRIISKGKAAYTVDNCQWVCKTDQMMKRDMSDEEYMKQCNRVARHNPDAEVIAA